MTNIKPLTAEDVQSFVPVEAENFDAMVAAIAATPDLKAIGLGAPIRPQLHPSVHGRPVRARLQALQEYICAFQYNHTGKQYFNVRKNRSLAKIMDTAKQVVRDALPIKCIEAVFLALFLTAGMEDVDRIPVGFKTRIDGQVFKHIILAVRHKDKYGALGLSRNADLMYKDLTYDSLSALLTEYRDSYAKWWHKVLVIRIGLPVEHSLNSYNQVCWRYLCVKPALQSWEQTCADVDAFAGMARRLWDRWVFEGGTVRKSASANAASGEPGGAGPPTPTSPYLQKVSSPLMSARRSAAAESSASPTVISATSGGSGSKDSQDSKECTDSRDNKDDRDGGSREGDVTGHGSNAESADGDAQPAGSAPECGAATPGDAAVGDGDEDASDGNGDEDSSDDDIPLMSPPRGGRKQAPAWMQAARPPGNTASSSPSAPVSPLTKKPAPTGSASKGVAEGGGSKGAASKGGLEKGAGGSGSGGGQQKDKDKGNGPSGHRVPSKRHATPSPPPPAPGEKVTQAAGEERGKACWDGRCSSDADAKDVAAAGEGPVEDGRASTNMGASGDTLSYASPLAPVSGPDGASSAPQSPICEDPPQLHPEANAAAAGEDDPPRAQGLCSAGPSKEGSAHTLAESPHGMPATVGKNDSAASPKTPGLAAGGQSLVERGAAAGGRGPARANSSASPMRRQTASRAASRRGSGHVASAGKGAEPASDTSAASKSVGKAPGTGTVAASLAAAKGVYVPSPDKGNHGASTASPLRQRPVPSSRQKQGPPAARSSASPASSTASKVGPPQSPSGHTAATPSPQGHAPPHTGGSSAGLACDHGRHDASATPPATSSHVGEIDATAAATNDGEGGTEEGDAPPCSEQHVVEGAHASRHASISEDKQEYDVQCEVMGEGASEPASPLHLPQLVQHATSTTFTTGHCSAADGNSAHPPDRPSSVHALPPLVRQPSGTGVSEHRQMEAENY